MVIHRDRQSRIHYSGWEVTRINTRHADDYIEMRTWERAADDKEEVTVILSSMESV